jgi:hypothetical protein
MVVDSMAGGSEAAVGSGAAGLEAAVDLEEEGFSKILLLKGHGPCAGEVSREWVLGSSVASLHQEGCRACLLHPHKHFFLPSSLPQVLVCDLFCLPTQLHLES